MHANVMQFSFTTKTKHFRLHRSLLMEESLKKLENLSF